MIQYGKHNSNFFFHEATELIGFRRRTMKKVIDCFSQMAKKGTMLEEILCRYIRTNNSNWVRLRALHIPQQYRVKRGWGDTLSDL
jgi:hypothetical protein